MGGALGWIRKLTLLELLHLVAWELDLLMFVAAGLGTGAVNMVLSASSTVRPVFVGDAGTWNLYPGDTISSAWVFAVLYLIVTPLIVACEYWIGMNRRHLTQRRACVTALRLGLGIWTSTMIAIMFVELGKNYVGRPRPSFLRSCLGTNVEGPPSSSFLGPAVIFSDADCPALDREHLFEARRSFPSGHASLSVGGALYAQLYLLYAIGELELAPDGVVSSAVNLLSYIPMAFGFWVAASRIVDNAHHVSDVACGSMVGAWAAVVHFMFVRDATRRAEATDRIAKESGCTKEE